MNHIKYGLVSRFAETKDVNPKSVRHTVHSSDGVWKEKINEISNKFNLDKKSILKNYFNYIIRKKPDIISDRFLTILEMLMHSNDSNIDHILQYYVLHISAYISQIVPERSS